MATEEKQSGGGGRKKKGQNVKIYARIRQLMPWEPRKVSLFIRGKKVENHTPSTHNEYLFQNTFDTDVENEDIFKTMVRPMIENVLDGFNAILIAYGQTGSGKTYSMLGKPDLNIVGLLPQMLGYAQAQESVKSVELSAVEAFGHHVSRVELFDLFNPDNQTRAWHDKVGRTQLNPKQAIKIPIQSQEDAHAKIIYAHAASHFAPTGKNPESSRGHVCFVAKITQAHPEIEHADLISYFVMVDCAGSEGESAFTPDFKASVDKATLMARRLEAGTINTGLSQLQVIFNELRFKGKLTKVVGNGLRRILHSYINTKTFLSVLFTLSPSVNNSKSTESTLKFAVTAGMVKVKPVKADARVNLDSLVEQLRGVIAQNEAEIDKQQEEITQLQIDLETARQDAISNGTLALEDTLPSARKKIRKSRLVREQMNLETLTALPAEVLAQLQELDEEESSDEELEDMFTQTAAVDVVDVDAEMAEALRRMNQSAESQAIIRSVVQLPEAGPGGADEELEQAMKDTLNMADMSVSQITFQNEEAKEQETGIQSEFIDFAEFTVEELNTHAEETWTGIEDVRVDQDRYRDVLGQVVLQLRQSQNDPFKFQDLNEVLDALEVQEAAA